MFNLWARRMNHDPSTAIEYYVHFSSNVETLINPIQDEILGNRQRRRMLTEKPETLFIQGMCHENSVIYVSVKLSDESIEKFTLEELILLKNTKITDMLNHYLITHKISAMNPLQCEICSTSYETKHEVTKCKDRHRKAEPWICEFCNRKMNKSSKSRHLDKCRKNPKNDKQSNNSEQEDSEDSSSVDDMSTD